jgi:hypothetical protein
MFVFTDAFLLSWIRKLHDHAGTLSSYSKYHAPSPLKERSSSRAGRAPMPLASMGEESRGTKPG